MIFNMNKEKFLCREDESNMKIFQLILQEMTIKFVTILLKVIFALSVKVVGFKEWRIQFNESDQIVWMLNFQMILWFSSVLFPIIAYFQPIFLLFVFYTYYGFSHFTNKPIQGSNEENTGHMILIFLNLSVAIQNFIIAVAMIFRCAHYQWATDPSRLCGPYPHNTSFEKPLVDFIIQRPIPQKIYLLFDNWPVTCFLYLILCSLLYRGYSTVGLMYTWITEKIEEFQFDSEQLSNFIQRREQRIAAISKLLTNEREQVVKEKVGAAFEQLFSSRQK